MNSDKKNEAVFSLAQRQANRCLAALENEEEELTEWETKFLTSCSNQYMLYQRELSEKQLACLETIENVIKNGRKGKR